MISRTIVNEIIKYDLPYPYVDGLILRATSKIEKLETYHSPRTIGKSRLYNKKAFTPLVEYVYEFLNSTVENCINIRFFIRTCRNYGRGVYSVRKNS